ncbi:MAG: transcription elongation factor GreA [bacterium]
MNEKKLLTKEEFERLKAELEDLKTVKRSEIAKKLQEAKSQGDLSENAEYSEARESQSFLEGRILMVENMLSNSKVIESRQRDFITVGAKVKINIDGAAQDFEIVGADGADPFNFKISIESPLGQALDGLKVGEETEFETPSGKKTIKIVAIN